MQRSTTDHIVVGLDIGTTKIAVVVGEIIRGTVEFRGMHAYPSAGMRKGIVVNMEEMILSIRNALQEAGSAFDVDINSVYTSITGSHIKGSCNVGSIGIGGREVASADIDRVFDSARAVYVPLDREVLHVMPAGYAIDGQNGIRDPLGMTGERLEAKVFAITGAATPIQNLLRCCEKAGVEVADMVFAPVASAGAMLTEDERELGVALVDIGGGTTDILLYKDGWPIHASVIAVGGNHFTNDLAVGLKIPVDEAERIKKCFGAATQMVTDSEQIEIIPFGQKRTIYRRHVAEILQARTEEFIGLIEKEFPSGSSCESSLTGVVLTGGGSLLNGLDKAAEEIWGLPVRSGDSIINIHGIQGPENSGACSVGAGLVRYGFEESSEEFSPRDAVTGIFSRMKAWAKEIFKIHKGGIEYVRN